jgi:hypothetical protein
LKKKELLIFFLILCLTSIIIYSLYFYCYSKASQPTIGLGTIGFTLAGKGGGPGDCLTLEPTEPQWWERASGSNFFFGPWDKARLVLSVRVVPILASLVDTDVNISMRVNNVQLFLDTVHVPGDGNAYAFDIRRGNLSLYMPSGSNGALDIYAVPRQINGTEKTIAIWSDSYVWFDFLEAPYSRLPSVEEFLTIYGLSLVTIVIALSPIIARYIWKVQDEIRQEKTVKLLEEIRDLLKRRNDEQG